MANKETPPPPPADGAPPPKSKKMLIIAAIAAVLIIAIGAGAFMLLKPHPPADDEESAEVEKPKKKDKKKKDEKHAAPAYLKMDAYTVNLTGEGGDQYLRLEMTAQFEEMSEAEKAKQYMPSIRNKVLLLLSGKKAAELSPKEGKEKLAEEIRDQMNMILEPPAGGKKPEKGVEGPVKEVLFTEFVIQ